MLTQYRNDLVKAVAAVNKNVIVVGELAHERFAVALLGLMLIYWGSSQRRTNHPRIDLVERQRTSHRVGWVSVVTESTSRSLLTNAVCLAKNWVTASLTFSTVLPLQAASFLTPSQSKHPTMVLPSSVGTMTIRRDFTSTTGTSTRRALLLATSSASVSVSNLSTPTPHGILTVSKRTQHLTTPA